MYERHSLLRTIRLSEYLVILKWSKTDVDNLLLVSPYTLRWYNDFTSRTYWNRCLYKKWNSSFWKNVFSSNRNTNSLSQDESPRDLRSSVKPVWRRRVGSLSEVVIFPLREKWSNCSNTVDRERKPSTHPSLSSSLSPLLSDYTISGEPFFTHV